MLALPASSFAARRTRVRDSLPAGGALLLPTNVEQHRNGDVHYPFRPDSDFFWLTGFDDPQPHLPHTVGGVDEADPAVPVVSSFDPRPWLRRHARRADLAAVGFVLASAACTVPMLWPPQLKGCRPSQSGWKGWSHNLRP